MKEGEPASLKVFKQSKCKLISKHAKLTLHPTVDNESRKQFHTVLSQVKLLDVQGSDEVLKNLKF